MQHIRIILNHLLFLKMIIYQYIELSDHIERLLPFRVYRELLTRDPGTQNNETFQQDTQHLLLQIILYGILVRQAVSNITQGGDLRFAQFQLHHIGSPIKKKTITRHLIVMSENTIEVAIKQKCQVLAIDRLELDMVQRRQGDNLTFH